MLRKILIILVINLCLFMSIVNAQVFENITYGFSVSIPDKWRVESKPAKFLCFNNEKKDVVMGIFFVPHSGARSLLENYFILKRFMETFIKETHATIAEPSKLNEVAGQPALLITLLVTRPDGIQTKALVAAFWYNDIRCFVICSAKQEEYDGSLPVFKEMIDSFKFNSMTAWDWDEKGTVYQENKEYAKAVEAFSKSNKLDPMQAEYVYHLACTYSEMGKYDQAIAEITRAIELKPGEAFYYHDRAYAYAQQKNGQAALDDANKAIQLNPKNATFYAGRGNAYALLGKYTDAIKDFEKQIEIKGESSDSSFNLGQCYEFLGNHEEALRYYNKTKGYSDIPEEVKAKVTARIGDDWESFKGWI